MRAIDFHVHLPTPEWLDVSMRGYIEAAEAYFRSTVARRSLEELAGDYEAIDVMAVLLAWDAETATGRPRVPNELVAQACRDHPRTFIGFGSVDPLKGARAVEELNTISELGLKGVKLHPSLQVPHRYQWHRSRAARRSGHQARLRKADPPRRCGRLVPEPERHRRSFRIPVASRAACDGASQDEPVHRHLGLGAEVHPR
ncbi:MAG: hypothetical protein E6J12_10145 [Chloroflexi bacterium]|nr:MAG: hypothetical protein E6J12_10145 [Chloroflexota bacterium]